MAHNAGAFHSRMVLNSLDQEVTDLRMIKTTRGLLW